MIIPKITKTKFSSAFKLAKFIKQMIDVNDWGIYKKHANTKTFINYCLKNGYAYHTLKIAIDAGDSFLSETEFICKYVREHHNEQTEVVSIN